MADPLGASDVFKVRGTSLVLVVDQQEGLFVLRHATFEQMAMAAIL
ncbi:MAG: hypothetical protein OXU20_14895 [Myxococcales bacterium]|nr:hypothetical protein [Myxococcales bacterium]MDD9971612.1 hypothetical protein [Myxococcales bacterium]